MNKGAIDIPKDGTMEIRKMAELYALYPDAQEGICTEAMKRVVDFIFTETKMDRLQGNANVKNTGSDRVLEKSGFQLESTIRHGKMVSEYCDYNIWGIIRDDMA